MPNSYYFSVLSNNNMGDAAKRVRRQCAVNMPAFFFRIIGNLYFSSINRIIRLPINCTEFINP